MAATLLTTDADRSRAPTTIERSAWNLARELTLPSAVLEKLRKVYAAGAELNSRIAIVDRHLSSPVAADSGSDTFRRIDQHQKGLTDASHRAADDARTAFEAARDALKPLV